MKYFRNIGYIVAAATAITSCASLPYFYPDKNYHPLATKDGDIQAEAAVFRSDQLSGYLFSGSYAISNHSLFFGTLDFNNKSMRYEDVIINVGGADTVLDRTDISLKSSMFHWRAGYAWYYPFGKYFTAGAQVSAGSGLLRYTGYDLRMNNREVGMRELNAVNYSIGPYISVKGKTAFASLNAQIYSTRFSNATNRDQVLHGTGHSYESDFANIKTGKNYLFFQPSLQVGIGAEGYQLFANYTRSNPFNYPGWHYIDNTISLGLIIDLNLQKTKPK